MKTYKAIKENQFNVPIGELLLVNLNGPINTFFRIIKYSDIVWFGNAIDGPLVGHESFEMVEV